MVRIFIVDDEEDIRTLFERFLILRGFDVLTPACNGKEAIDMFIQFNPKPDIILMDHHMPLKTGIEAAKEIKQLNGNVKIIFISGDTQIKEKALATGAIDFIIKPFKVNDIIESITNALAS
ncbi:MAG: response regulator [Promethearchaeota archaeon]